MRTGERYGLDFKVVPDEPGTTEGAVSAVAAGGGRGGRAAGDVRGKPGRLLVRGAYVARRYWKGAADCVDGEGWFDTGDVGVVDEEG